jgi:hypothetical protein
MSLVPYAGIDRTEVDPAPRRRPMTTVAWFEILKILNRSETFKTGDIRHTSRA